MSDRTIVVTGGAGFIGSHMTRALLQRGERVIVLDDLNDFYDPEIKKANIAEFSAHANFRFVLGDIRDEKMVETLFDEVHPDVLLHLAARAGVRPSLKDPALYADVNVRGTAVLLHAAEKCGVKHAVLASSSSVYGSRSEAKPFREDEVLGAAASPYGASKQAMERFAETHALLTGMTISCLRFFTVYGPGQRPDMAIHQFTKKIIAGESIHLFGDGTSVRDYTYIDDIVQGVLGAIDHPHGYRVYNLGESHTTSLKELIDLIGKISGKEPEIDWQPFQKGDVPATFADITRAKEELGYAPSTPIDQGLQKFVDWSQKK